ncbi:thioredoxin family protein [Ralstonia solanacearum]|uniref:thioredoxin family protein n=1 Tax=Ralstonia solanacearum TaxID=305 RepID=UPI0006DC9A40|nr:thioredoxin family protein [Ralstonia solanacearum]
MMTLIARSLVAFVLLFSSVFAQAGEQRFSQKAFDDLRAAGKPVLLHVHATWCPICKKQAQVISALESEDRFKSLTVMRVDFDTEKAVQAALKVNARSTMIAFKGETEVGRSVGDTNPDSIAALLAKPLQ